MVSESKVALNVGVESIVVQLTNEMVEVLYNFYRALTRVRVCVRVFENFFGFAIMQC